MGTIETLKRITKLLLSRIHSISGNKKYMLLIAIVIIIKATTYILIGKNPKRLDVMPLSDLLNPMNLRFLDEVLVKSNKIISIDKLKNIKKTIIPENSVPSIMNKLLQFKISVYVQEVLSSRSVTQEFLLYFMGSLITTALGFLLYKFLSKEDTKKSIKAPLKVKFKDIIGLENTKQALKQTIQFFENPGKYQQFGARMRRGILLYGPPGTGKTTLAKACSNQANVSFFSCNAAQFCQIYVGMGPKKIRDLFAKAKQQAPSIIYIDELDAFGTRGSVNIYQNANSQKNSTINQILSELDGFESSQKVLVIGSTNRLEMVDNSLLRAGRFDIKIYTPLPNLQDRVKIFQHYLANKPSKLSEQFMRDQMGKRKGWSGADIEALLNQSAHYAMRRSSRQIQEVDIINSLKEIQANSQKNVRNRLH